MPRSDRYSIPAITLHWLVAALVLAQYPWGWWMQTIAKQPVGPRVDAYNLHKSVGLVILALMLIRLVWRLTHEPPPLPPMPRWQARLARVTHLTLYGALIVMPLAGYLGSVWSGYPVKWFGITLPNWMPRNDPMKDWMSRLHFATSFVLLGAVALHFAGVILHLRARDRLLARMGVGRDLPGGATLAQTHASSEHTTTAPARILR